MSLAAAAATPKRFGATGFATGQHKAGIMRDGTPDDSSMAPGSGKEVEHDAFIMHDRTNPFFENPILGPKEDGPIRYSEKPKLPVGEDQVLKEAAKKPEDKKLDPYQTNPNPTKAWFTEGENAPFTKPKPASEPEGSADNLKFPEYDTSFGQFEVRPSGTGNVGVLRYEKYKREPPSERVKDRDVKPMGPVHQGHHPFYDYSATGGVRENYTTKVSGTVYHWDLKASMHSLYRQCLRGIPIIKNYYMLLLSQEKMKERIRLKFEQNKYLKDLDSIKSVLHIGWMNYTEVICMSMQKFGVLKFFRDQESSFDQIKSWTEEEGKMLEERAFWNGEEQKKEGPYDGHWSLTGKLNAEEFKKLNGRTPMSWSSGKGYFELFKADGTNSWEKNLDYEGWFTKNVDPDRNAARKEIAQYLETTYTQPKHYVSKNRRAYRRLVKDVEGMLTHSTHELYAQSREQLFQLWIRDVCPESNRVAAEKRLAKHDDVVFTTKFDEMEKAWKQACREFPNPRLWKTDAFYLRMRHLNSHLEYNWARAPIGVGLERAFNEWVSSDTNYSILNSDAFAAVRADKTKNPMARSWADFYRDFDPDVPETRNLPWYHPDFNYDRRFFWDERCMRMKKWVDCGDVDFRHNYFDAIVAEQEQLVHRAELLREPEHVDQRYSAPRMVQLYRALGKRMDVALVNQMREAMIEQGVLPNSAETQKMGEKAVEAALAKADFSNFKFAVPVVIYPDNYEQPKLAIDGRAIAA